MNDSTTPAAAESVEVRRRRIFIRHIGELVEVKRAYVRRFPADHATLVEVKRTRAIVQFLDAPLRRVKAGPLGIDEKLVPEEWAVPLEWLLLPGCVESDPRQMDLFGEAAS